MGVAAVEDLAEQAAEQVDDLARHTLFGGNGRVLLDRDRYVPDLATGRPGDLFDSLGEGQKPRAGQLVELAYVLVLSQRRDSNVGDVVGVDERLRGVTGRKGRAAI